mmetsp:Transcript_128438/g.363495  ORF Transcript_128438/g.363495 Transcript_128438/m.363495 type:complete len:214 (-) Transcript_128438:819-1460(-)
MINDCSVLAISSRTSSRPEFLDSCSCLHPACRLQRSATSDAAATENSAFMALVAVRFRNAVKSLVSSRGCRECSRRRESRTEWMQDTTTRVGGYFCSRRAESLSQNSSTHVLTKVDSVPSSTEPPVWLSCSFWKPSTASQRWGTYDSVAMLHEQASITLSGRCRSFCSLESSTKASLPAEDASAAMASSVFLRLSAGKHSSRDLCSTAALPLR